MDVDQAITDEDDEDNDDIVGEIDEGEDNDGENPLDILP